MIKAVFHLEFSKQVPQFMSMGTKPKIHYTLQMYEQILCNPLLWRFLRGEKMKYQPWGMFYIYCSLVIKWAPVMLLKFLDMVFSKSYFV